MPRPLSHQARLLRSSLMSNLALRRDTSVVTAVAQPLQMC